MLSARALIYAILVMLLITVLSSTLVGIAHIHQLQQNSYEYDNQVIYNANAGIALLKADSALVFRDTVIDLYDRGMDTVYLQKYWWGAYQVGSVEATIRTTSKVHEFTKTILLGSQPSKEQQAALYLPNNNRPLSLVGNTLIKGKAYASRAGIKRGYIQGQSFRRAKLVEGEILQSRRNLPALRPDRKIAIQQSFKMRGSTAVGDTLIQPFEKPPVSLFGNTVYLQEVYLGGRVVVRSDSLIYVGATAQLDNILLLAPNIVFEKGFKGKVQAFASSRIIVNNGVKLSYPSVLCLLTPRKTGSILLESNTLIEGEVLAHIENDNPIKMPVLIQKKDAIINGIAYANKKYDLKGIVQGSVLTAGFTVQTPSSIYDNHLFNATIDYSLRSANFLSTGLWESNHPDKIILPLNSYRQ